MLLQIGLVFVISGPLVVRALEPPADCTLRLPDCSMTSILQGAWVEGDQVVSISQPLYQLQPHHHQQYPSKQASLMSLPARTMMRLLICTSAGPMLESSSSSDWETRVRARRYTFDLA